MHSSRPNLRLSNIKIAKPAANLIFINNQNSRADVRLEKTIAAYERQHLFRMTSLHHETTTLKKFLKDIYLCPSDNDPVAKK